LGAVWSLSANVGDWDCVVSRRKRELLNRYTGQNLYRGFESLPLRQISAKTIQQREFDCIGLMHHGLAWWQKKSGNAAQ